MSWLPLHQAGVTRVACGAAGSAVASSQYANATNNPIARFDHDPDAGGNQDVHSGAEFHQADALAQLDVIALLLPEDDAASQRPGYLPGNYGELRAPDRNYVLLVLNRGDVPGGHVKASRFVNDIGDIARDRRTVDMDVEWREEDRNLNRRFIRRRLDWSDRDDASVGGRNYQAGTAGRDSRRVAEEEGH